MAIKLKVGERSLVGRCDEPQADLNQLHYPHAALLPDGTVYVHYYISPWRGMESVVVCTRSEDGRRWTSPVHMPTAPMMDPAVLPNGTIFYLTRLRLVAPGLILATRCESTDRGDTWQVRPESTSVEYPRDIAVDPSSPPSYWGQSTNFIYQYGVHGGEDGSILALFGAHCSRGHWIRLMLFRSLDEGNSFRYVSTVGGMDNPGHGGFSEPTIARMTDGSLLVVARTEYPPDDWRYMAQFRSIDEGTTWSAPVVPPGIPPVYRIRSQRPLRNSGKIYSSAGNVSPCLAVLENGVAALSFGRPGLKVAFSEDGTGSLWTDALRVVPEQSLFGINDETSSMSGLIATGPDSLLLVYDVQDSVNEPAGKGRNSLFALPIAATP